MNFAGDHESVISHRWIYKAYNWGRVTQLSDFVDVPVTCTLTQVVNYFPNLKFLIQEPHTLRLFVLALAIVVLNYGLVTLQTELGLGEYFVVFERKNNKVARGKKN